MIKKLEYTDNGGFTTTTKLKIVDSMVNILDRYFLVGRTKYNGDVSDIGNMYMYLTRSTTKLFIGETFPELLEIYNKPIDQNMLSGFRRHGKQKTEHRWVYLLLTRLRTNILRGYPGGIIKTYDSYPIELTLGNKYHVSVHGSPVEVVTFIKSTPKGYNFLQNNNTCILKKALYRKPPIIDNDSKSYIFELPYFISIKGIKEKVISCRDCRFMNTHVKNICDDCNNFDLFHTLNK